ncbi:MAG: PQQ-binding-like beta-propeller repeat protein [Kofleriaceae bacterium]|nr:PQQ-binding-like beta-propeller repeat protein [Myxococcales bacterium]MCB9571996.1 PQQ-binding-like beta-propeller repeat protein [Kofleriaceae bacterium]
MSRLSTRLGATLALLLAAGAAACTVPADQADPMRAVPRGELGRPVMALRWKLVTSDRSSEVKPQEFASPLLYRDHVYAGSEGGTFWALRAKDGRLRWKRKLGAVSARPAVDRGFLYVGTDDGLVICLDHQTGKEIWRHATRGAILQPPVMVDVPPAPDAPSKLPQTLVIVANEADQISALDAKTGEFRWQYKGETPDEYTLRGHAGVVIRDGLVFSGFSSGTLVALRVETGSVAWLTSLKGDADRFVDVDATPVVVGDSLYVTSSAGGLWALDRATGLVRWQSTLGAVGPDAVDGGTGTLTTDGERLYVGVADHGIYALDLEGNVLWRQGARGGGEPGEMLVTGDYLMYTLADAGLFVADRRTGRVLEYFDPGDGVSAAPVVSDDDVLYLMSNRGVLYALDLERY